MSALWPALQLIAVFGFAFAVIRWVGGLARDVATGASSPAAPLAPSGGFLDDIMQSMDATHTLRAHGIVNDAQLQAMSPRERELLLSVTASRLPASPRTVPAARVPRRAVGLDVYCPACGEALPRQELKRTGRVTCASCTREVSASIRIGQMSITVEETDDEAARRLRLTNPTD